MCKTCGSAWDAALQAHCPECQASTWAQTSDLVRPKHDPGSVASAHAYFRSVMTEEFTNGSVAYLLDIASTGTVFQSMNHAGKYCVFAPAPAGTGAGSTIFAGSVAPSYALDSYLIADSIDSPHIYAEDQARFLHGISAGSYVPLPQCVAGSCDNLAMPKSNRCVQHTYPSLAD